MRAEVDVLVEGSLEVVLGCSEDIVVGVMRRRGAVWVGDKYWL